MNEGRLGLPPVKEIQLAQEIAFLERFGFFAMRWNGRRRVRRLLM